MASTSAPSPPYQQSRRDQRAQQELSTGPPIPPPPRTSSSQRSRTANLPSAALTDRIVPTQYANATEDRPHSSRGPQTENVRLVNDRDRGYAEDPPLAGEPEPTNDATTAVAAAARARRRGPISPEMPQRARSHREPGAQQPPSAVQSRSVSNVATATSPAKPVKEEGQVINRVVVTDPQIDIAREQERQAEAVPIQDTARSANVASSEGATVQRRQDHSASASRRKETKFGEYVLGQTLGEGEFGKVKLGWKKDGSVQVAIKLIRLEALGSNQSRLPKIRREISILRELSHPNIVRLHEMVETKAVIGIILEYASGGELFDYILNQRYLKDNSARRLFAQLVSGVGYLHKKGIVHRDLKLENLLLDRNRNIIITDFGFANNFDPRDELPEDIDLSDRNYLKKMGLDQVKNGSRRGDLMQTSCGSPCYAAPELVVTDSLYTGRKVDVWSCGVILVGVQFGTLGYCLTDTPPSMPCLLAICHSTMIQLIPRATTSIYCTSISFRHLLPSPNTSRRMLETCYEGFLYLTRETERTCSKLPDIAG